MVCVKTADILVKKTFFLCLILFVTSNNIFSASRASRPGLSSEDLFNIDAAQDSSSYPLVMMSDGKKSRAVPMEEFLNVAMKDSAKNKKDLQSILDVKKNLENGSIQDLISASLKDSFVVDVLKESAIDSGKAIKSLARSVIKGIAVGAVMGVVLLIGGAIVWQVIVVPAYCKGPGPVIASWMPVSDYWQWGEDGVCKNYVGQSNNFAPQVANIKHVAQLISQEAPDVILPDDSVYPNLFSHCNVENGKIVRCDNPICKIAKNIRGC